MNTRHASRWFWLTLFAIFLAPCLARTAATQSQPGSNSNSAVQRANGLTVVTFTVDPGKIIVKLPDDIAAGDTISGVVVPEPNGGTDDERNKNRDVLNGYAIQIGNQNFPVSKGKLGPIVFPGGNVLATPPGSTGNVPPSAPSFFDIFVEVQLGGKPVGWARVPLLPSGAVITPDPKITPPGTTQSGAVITLDPKITLGFNIPHLGQTGRLIVITGPFDGNSSNTSLNWTRPRSPNQDFEKNTENVSGGFGLIAESPRKAIFVSPTDVNGPMDLSLDEGKTETKGTFRNVDLKLTAPKTNLRRGEHTELHVEVNGLQGITQPVPLRLESTGVITMEGGNYQPLVIQPSQVGADGRYTTTRGITGVHAGGWGATATVVVQPFDICLQDDNNPQTVILFNSFTGEYKFTAPPVPPPVVQPGGAPGQTGGAAKPNETKQSGGTTQVVSGPVVPSIPTLFPGPVFIGPATGTVTRDGCTISLNDNRPDRVVIATVDMCSHTGTASVQISPPNSPKIKFTITDRNTADNTCSCGPGCK